MDGVGSEKELDLKLHAKNLVILAPGTNEGGVMVVSTKPRYSADAPSLAFEKNYLNPPSKGRVQGVYHQTLCTLVLQGESTGCLSLNTPYPF